MSNKGYMKLSNDPSSSDTFVHDTFQKQEVCIFRFLASPTHSSFRRLFEIKMRTWTMWGPPCIQFEICPIELVKNWMNNPSEFFSMVAPVMVFLLSAFRMLDDLGHAMINTESRLDNVMKKIAKISKLDDG